jgi:nucleoside-diphosphate-sugar epimerase
MKGSERFLVTGALGCIGAWIVRRLLREAVPVVGFDADTDTQRLRLLLGDEQLARVDLVQGDITDARQLEDVLDAQGITHVIHLAAVLHPRFKADPALGVRVNALGSVNLFEAAARRSAQIRRIVYASSIAVYGPSDVPPGAAVMHDTVGRPGTLYGVFKQAEEAAARVYFHDRGVTSIGLRPATVFGAGRDFGLTAAPTEAVLALAKGQQFHIPYDGRSHLHYADDLARIFIACARADHCGAQAFNIRGTTADMREIVETIESVTGCPRGTVTYGGPSLDLPEDYDDSALERVIGPLPRTPLCQAVQDTYDIFRNRIPN